MDFEYLGLRGFNAGNFPFPSTLPGAAVGPPTAFFNTATSVSADWLFTARPRVGWAMREWLLYVTGGLAVGRENFSQTIAILAPFTETSGFATTRAGWTVGGGIEYAIARNWSIRGEYLHVDLGTVNTAGTLTPPFPGLTLTGSVRLTTEIARADSIIASEPVAASADRPDVGFDIAGQRNPGELQACERKPAASQARGWGDLRFATIRRYSAKLRIADLRLRTAFGVNTGTAFGASQCSA